MNAKLSDIPEEIRDKLIKEGKLPPQMPHKRQNDVRTSDKTHERLASVILAFWHNWCHWCGIIGAGIVGIVFLALVIVLGIWIRKGN